MKATILVLTILFSTLSTLAGGSCHNVKILEIFNERSNAFSLRVEHPGYAAGVAVSERKQVRGKKKEQSIIEFRYGMKNSSHKYEHYLENLTKCRKIFKERIKSKKKLCLGFLGGVFVQGYERVFKARGLFYSSRQHERAKEKNFCYIIQNPHY